jgi:hypothetical protein
MKICYTFSHLLRDNFAVDDVYGAGGVDRQRGGKIK